jgi:hypothetical protein
VAAITLIIGRKLGQKLRELRPTKEKRITIGVVGLKEFNYVFFS